MFTQLFLVKKKKLKKHPPWCSEDPDYSILLQLIGEHTFPTRDTKCLIFAFILYVSIELSHIMFHQLPLEPLPMCLL